MDDSRKHILVVKRHTFMCIKFENEKLESVKWTLFVEETENASVLHSVCTNGILKLGKVIYGMGCDWKYDFG